MKERRRPLFWRRFGPLRNPIVFWCHFPDSWRRDGETAKNGENNAEQKWARYGRLKECGLLFDACATGTFTAPPSRPVRSKLFFCVLLRYFRLFVCGKQDISPCRTSSNWHEHLLDGGGGHLHQWYHSKFGQFVYRSSIFIGLQWRFFGTLYATSNYCFQ